MGYNDRWGRHRRAFWQHFNPAAAKRHGPTQSAFARILARKLLEDPSDLAGHIR